VVKSNKAGKRNNEHIRRYRLENLSTKTTDLGYVLSRKSYEKFHTALNTSYQISEDGQTLVAIQIYEEQKSQIIKENLNFGQLLYFPRPNHGLINTLMLVEKKNILLSGSASGVACIYDWQEANLLKEINMTIGNSNNLIFLLKVILNIFKYKYCWKPHK
jgi:hypothetical protein